jgi:BirA family biotin operon repressor/biotin-[acetyl-CoA-carboxylase] ligase
LNQPIPPTRWNRIDLDETTSTSDVARKLVLEGSTPLPFVVRAKRQSAGRGRGSHSWWSDEGSLTFTAAVDPGALGLRVQDQHKASLAAGVALVDALPENAPSPTLGIRWPNDVEFQGKKLAGILCELVQTATGSRLLVGIGLNVRTNFETAPSEIRNLATSLSILAGETIGPEHDEPIVFRTLDRLLLCLQMLATGNAYLPMRWSALDLLAGTDITVDQAGVIVRGRACGIGLDGALLLRTEERGIVEIRGGQILR